MDEKEELIRLVKHEYRIQKIYNISKIIAVFAKNISLWRLLSFYLTIIINIIIVTTYRQKKDGLYDEENRTIFSSVETDEKWMQWLNTLGIIQICMSIFIVIYFQLKTAPLILDRVWSGFKPEDMLNIFLIIKRILRTAIKLITDPMTVYYICFQAFASILGVWWNPFFFALQLFEVGLQYPLLKFVLLSVWEPIDTIALTYLCYWVLNYIFTLFAYWKIHEDYDGYCEDTFNCLLTHVDKSFKGDGGIGGSLNPPPKPDNNADTTIQMYTRLIFDNLYNIFLMIIMINIVAGIIIDTFSEMRENQKYFNYDNNNICFVCGFDRDQIDKASGEQDGFDQHTLNDQNLWTYLWFVAYIQ